MSKDNGVGLGLFRVAYIGRGTKTSHTIVVPDFYIKTKGERHRVHLPEIVMGSGLLGLIAAGFMHFCPIVLLNKPCFFLFFLKNSWSNFEDRLPMWYINNLTLSYQSKNTIL